MASIFTMIIQGEIPCYQVAETADCIAFLDIRPLTKGHTLVVPKLEVDKLFDLPEAKYQAVMNLSHRVARALEVTMPCHRVGVAVLGFEVPHAHVHLVPLRNEAELNFANPKMQFSPEEMASIAQTIASALS